MTERGWFTLLVRGVGFYIIVTGVVMLLSYFHLAWEYFSQPKPAQAINMGGPVGQIVNHGPGPGEQLFLLFTPVAIQIGLGAYLLFAGGWIVNWLCRQTVGRCPRCGYDTGLNPTECPECGLRTASPKPTADAS